MANNNHVVREWASRRPARAPNLRTDGTRLWSYHTLIAMMHTADQYPLTYVSSYVAVISSETFSVTTSRHQSLAARAPNSYVTRWYVPEGVNIENVRVVRSELEGALVTYNDHTLGRVWLTGELPLSYLGIPYEGQLPEWIPITDETAELSPDEPIWSRVGAAVASRLPYDAIPSPVMLSRAVFLAEASALVIDVDEPAGSRLKRHTMSPAPGVTLDGTLYCPEADAWCGRVYLTRDKKNPVRVNAEKKWVRVRVIDLETPL